MNVKNFTAETAENAKSTGKPYPVDTVHGFLLYVYAAVANAGAVLIGILAKISMKRKLLLLPAIFLLFASSAYGASLDSIAGTLEDMADMAREADRARSAIGDILNGPNQEDSYHSRYRREMERRRHMADICGTDEAQIDRLRDSGMSWEEIGRKYNVDSGRYEDGWREHHGKRHGHHNKFRHDY